MLFKIQLCVYLLVVSPVAIIPPTSQNAHFLLSENERFGLVFVKTGSINSGIDFAQISPKRSFSVILKRSVVGRVRRSYSLKAKTSENVGIFVLALKRKKMFFFRIVRNQAKHSKQQKK
jgi:hypothetical protein